MDSLAELAAAARCSEAEVLALAEAELAEPLAELQVGVIARKRLVAHVARARAEAAQVSLNSSSSSSSVDVDTDQKRDDDQREHPLMMRMCAAAAAAGPAAKTVLVLLPPLLLLVVRGHCVHAWALPAILGAVLAISQRLSVSGVGHHRAPITPVSDALLGEWALDPVGAARILGAQGGRG
jgi:hypothetical protein